MTHFSISLALFCIFCIGKIFGQAQYDASVKRFLSDLKSERFDAPTHKFIQEYDITKIQGSYTIGALVQVQTLDALTVLENLGIHPKSQAGTIYTLRIPLNLVELVMGVSGISRIEIGSSLSMDMERELNSARVDSVHNNWGDLLDQPYFGTGVVIGIIDWGFDYTHPNFYDTTLPNLRLDRAWDQNKNNGPAPTNYGFGTEYTSPSELLAAQEDTLYVFGPGSHGTHVAGIAGGSG